MKLLAHPSHPFHLHCHRRAMSRNPHRPHLLVPMEAISLPQSLTMAHNLDQQTLLKITSHRLIREMTEALLPPKLLQSRKESPYTWLMIMLIHKKLSSSVEPWSGITDSCDWATSGPDHVVKSVFVMVVDTVSSLTVQIW